MWDKLGRLNRLWQFLFENLSSFNAKGFCYSYMHGLAFHVKKLPFALELSLENSADSYLCFWLALVHLVYYFFFLYRSPSSSLYTVFDAISSNKEEVCSINTFANMFAFGKSNIHHKDWLSYSGGIDRSVELCYNFYISNYLTWMVNFPTQIPDRDSHSSALLDLFISSDPSICSPMVFPLLGNSDHAVVLVSLNSKERTPIHHRADMIGTVFMMIWEMFLGRYF